MRIGIVFTGVANEFVGGAERFFADFYDTYNSQKHQENHVFFITDKQSHVVFTKKLNKLKYAKNIIQIPLFHNRFKNRLEPLFFFIKLFINRIDVVHIGSYGTQYFYLLNFLSKLPNFIRPKIVVNIVDCEVAHIYNSPTHERYESYQKKYGPLFKTITIDGVYSWYKLFNKLQSDENIIRSSPYVKAIDTRFSDTSRFFPSPVKKNEIVYAARLTDQKKPLLFAKAVKILNEIYYNEIKDWKFFIYGKGPLEEEVRLFINNNQLHDVLSLASTSDMSEVFPYSRCFVSTQDYENFPSLSMTEAMASGNALIALNVGQTDYFVKDNINGYLVNSDVPEKLAEAIRSYILKKDSHINMQNESLRLIKEVHTSQNFIKEIDVFWNEIKNT